jgi:hypothetical protein
MPVRAVLAGLFAALSMAGSAAADSVSERPDSVAITAYRDAGGWDDEDYWEDWEEGPDEHDGLVLVTELRTVDIPAGRAKVSFRGVADGIIPQTAAIEGLPSAMLERNHDYDLLSPAALIAKSIGNRVRLVRTNKISGEVTDETAIVRSGPQGVVLDFGDGRVEAVGCSGWPERLIFEERPDGMADKPTLSVVTNAAQAGRHQVRLSYLAFGLKWGADYVARIHPDGKRLDLAGWITLANGSDTSFVNAPTQVVAGEVARDDQTKAPPISRAWRTPSCWQMDTTTRGSKAPVPPPPPAAFAPSDGADFVEALVVTAQRRSEDIQDAPIAISAFEGELADYKLYTLPEPTTVAARQTKQVMMLHQKDVPFERLYVRRLGSDYDEEDAEASVVTLRLQNKKEQGLGRALPGGRIAVMAPYDRGLLLAGEHRFRDAPVGQPLDITLGQSMDVRVADTELRNWGAGDDTRREHEVRLSNGKDEPVTVELRLRVGENLKLVSASQKHGRRYADLTWTFRLKPGERRTMRYVTEGY